MLPATAHCIRATTIGGPSMQPNLYGGHLAMTEKITYRRH